MCLLPLLVGLVKRMKKIRMNYQSIRTIIPRLAQWGCVGLLSINLYGCVAQQADVVRIKRELDAKISQLDKSKTSLQQAVGEANQALENAGSIISKQRAEIQELLHARAELMDQMATLKDTDLSQVKGALEKNQYQVGELNQRFGQMEVNMQTIRSQVQQAQNTLDPLVNQVRDRLGAGEQLLTEQGGKLGEFRSSLVEFQQALVSIRQSLVKQEQSVGELRTHVDMIGQTQNASTRQTQSNFEEVRRSIQSVIGTLEKVSTTFGKRLDEHEQKLHRIASSNGDAMGLHSRDFSSTESTGNLVEAKAPVISQGHQDFQSLSVPATANSSGPIPVQAAVAGGTHLVPRSVSMASPRDSSNGQLSVGGQAKDPRLRYEEAFQFLRDGNYSLAATAFSTFLRTFPESVLASNAQYWLAECYYGQRRFPEAIDEFERVFLLYPSSNKVPASLLKIAYSHLERQDVATARSVFQQLIRTYPQSPEALKAQSRLQEVNALLKTPS